MGTIIEIKTLHNSNLIYKVLLEKEEVLSLKNAIRNINIFTEHLCNTEAKMIIRGNKGVTKYFEIPFILRFRRNKNLNDLLYHKIETSSKVFYIYVIKKNNLF